MVEKKETWSILRTEPLDAAVNMAIDEALLRWHSEGKIKPTLRFYQWKTPSLSVGYFQKVSSSIDVDKLNEAKGQLVRRLTGGSAVLHDKELTYSIVVSERHPKIPKTVQEAYYVLAQGIVLGYRYLQVDASLQQQQPRDERSPVCFETPALYELVVGGKKISGNAQTRKKGVLLQHGSIPFQFDVDFLFSLFSFPNERVRQRKIAQFKEKAVALEDLLGRSVQYEEVEEAFYRGFTEALGINTEPLELSTEDWNEIHHLAETKYRSPAWTYHRQKDIIKGGNIYG